jgi:pimeloyl-ACP methyl ester carboxylesterase
VMAALREVRLRLDGRLTRAIETQPQKDAGQPPIVLFHGFSDSADTWRPLLAILARHGRRAVALDMPGFGRAGRLDRDEDILPQLDRFAASAVARQAELGHGRPVVVAGNSLGGCIALRVAEREDLPVAGVAPIAPAGLDMARWMAVIESERLLRYVVRSPVPVPERVVRELVGRTYSMLVFSQPGEIDAAVVRRFTAHVRSKRDVIRILATGRRLRAELRDPFRLHRVRCPVLVVWGEGDRMVFPAGAERVLRTVAGSRMELIERCGHCPQIEAPERLAELLASFPETAREAAA